MTELNRIDDTRERTSVRLARELLLIGPDGTDLKLEYLKTLIDHGLPQARRALRVLVIGAGMAGLSAAHLLQDAGHDVRVIEANANRLGGRLKTFRHDPARGVSSPFADPTQYAEAGGMRIPDTHPLTLALADKLGLRRRPFYNVDVDPLGSGPAVVPPVVYRSFTGEVWRNGPDLPDPVHPVPALMSWIDVNGHRVRRAEYAVDPTAVNASFGLGPHARQTAGDLFDIALAPAHEYHSTRSTTGWVELPAAGRVEGWARLIDDFDHLSMSQFLTRHGGLDAAAVDAIGTLENITSRMPLSFIHSYLTRAMINPGARYWEIEGGSWRLPYALAGASGVKIELDRQVVSIEHYDPARPHAPYAHVSAAGPQVWLRATTEDASEVHEFTGDVAIVTVPFAALRHVQIEPLLSYPKRRAIIELHYDSATKVLLEFNRRWWEFTEEDWKRELEAVRPGLNDHYQATSPWPADAIVGGGSVTDSPTGSCTTRRIRCQAALVEWSWPATPGPTTPADGTRCRTRTATSRPCWVSASYMASASAPSSPAAALRRAGPATRTPPVRRPSSRRASSPSIIPPSRQPRAPCTSPASTPRSSTPGSRARSSRVSAPRWK
ncbi:hypothetical protein GCM10022251_74920 [Phytohabitans flavus]|uniref:Amine oxidase domain-containing protein n=1 Tax=Phytohabitans flavus TaxID=1076124 RepID=A0A6F8XLI5_9ACTN|nr:NAD(P)/FAD-dependent oxidoreductase [Phytohabitans flavus]BCB74649.1 hypothetical protein Pflav_010590 [Phytohabitans flavus]